MRNILAFSLFVAFTFTSVANADSVESLGVDGDGNTVWKVVNTSNSPDWQGFMVQIGLETYTGEIPLGESTFVAGAANAGDVVTITTLMGAGIFGGQVNYTVASEAFTAPEAINATNISTNTSSISTNTADISTNTADISTNTADISTNTADISTNKTSIGKNSQAIADSMAFAMVQQDVNYGGFQLSLGVSSYEGYAGFALVGGVKVYPNTFMNFGATGRGNFAASVNFKF